MSDPIEDSTERAPASRTDWFTRVIEGLVWFADFRVMVRTGWGLLKALWGAVASTYLFFFKD